ncbi:DNA replication and repair protein RecF, partial [Candidatus Shapirobacteria bacterium]|nr:DNA replication and repair protein RecF [Candidatus Shapirobacteria bacterium]
RQTSLVVGPNASGKTNLLEAIYLLATGKSYRAEVESEMISYGEEMARVTCLVGQHDFQASRGQGEDLVRTENFPALGDPATPSASYDQSSTSRGINRAENRLPSENKSEVNLEIFLTTGSVSGKTVAKKIYKVNGVNKRMVDFLGNLRAVYFGPEDLELITDSPSLRRKYLDLVLSQVDWEYRRASLSYEKGLRQRNKILEEIQRYKDTKIQREEIRRRLFFWDQLLVKDGSYITQKREEFIGEVNKYQISSSDSEDKFQMEYKMNVISLAALEQNLDKEIILGQTLAGPHRDDIKFEISESRDLSLYGSRGEQRLAILWLKLGELEFVSQKTGARPVLLLDDIFSELDEGHRELVLKVIPKQQTLITTTDLSLVEKSYQEKMGIIKM